VGDCDDLGTHSVDEFRYATPDSKLPKKSAESISCQFRIRKESKNRQKRDAGHSKTGFVSQKVRAGSLLSNV
jgi:hypothetical protein